MGVQALPEYASSPGADAKTRCYKPLIIERTIPIATEIGTADRPASMTENHLPSKPGPAEIRAQRDKIVASKLFALSKRLRTFLSFIVDAALEGRADRLKEYTLGIDVFEKDQSFDPRIDSIVRVEAARLRNKLRDYYDGVGKSDPIRIDVPKGHYVPSFDYIKRNIESEEAAGKQQTRATVSKRNLAHHPLGWVAVGFVAAAVLFLVLVNFGLDETPPTPARVIDDKSIAVLPFLALSSGEDDGYFADGLTEEILNSLARLPELFVTARTSSFFFKDQNILIPDIANRLGVAHVVEGSVRRDGERLRIAVQLIRGSDNFHLWSQSYDRTRDDVFAVQKDIAERIAEVMGVVLDDASRAVMHGAGIEDVEAFIAYQKGQEAFANAHQGMNMSDALAIANAHFGDALQAAPGLTKVRLMKADLRGHILFEIIAGVRDEKYPGELQETLAALREEYRLAVELSPAGKKRDLLELERTFFSDDWGALPARIGKAMQPGGCAQSSWTNAFISPLGWARVLSTKYAEAITCDPLDTLASFVLASTFIWSGDSIAALEVIDEAEAKGLGHPFLEDARYWALLATGRLDDPATLGPGPGGGNMPYDRQILREALVGDPAVAREMADDYWSGPNANDFSSLVIAAVVGDRERANEVAGRIDAHPGSVVVLSSAIFTCYCGAPFDLEATPNYRDRLTEGQLKWPPLTRIDYPTKTW